MVISIYCHVIEYAPAKSGEYPSDFSQKLSMICSLKLSFSFKLCSQKTVCFAKQISLWTNISKHLFVPNGLLKYFKVNWGLYLSLLSFKYFFLQYAKFWKVGNVTWIFLSFSWDIFSYTKHLVQSHASKYIWWIVIINGAYLVLNKKKHFCLLIKFVVTSEHKIVRSGWSLVKAKTGNFIWIKTGLLSAHVPTAFPALSNFQLCFNDSLQ